MNTSTNMIRRLAVVAAVGAALLAAQLPSALGDTKPVDPADPATPATVSAKALPTVQVNGVVWSQVIVGNKVYAAGNFTTARSAVSDPVQSSTGRANLLAYDITTGKLDTAWAPTTDAQVRTITKSPDGSRIYVGGDFTKVNGQTRYRVAALNPTNGSLIAWAPQPNGWVRSLVATSDTVYIGGHFSAISGNNRTRIGSVNASTGAVLPFAPQLTYGDGNGYVWAMAVSPDASKVAFGGAFVTVNGSSNPGYGMAIVNATTGALEAMPANDVIRNAGANAAMTGMASDGDSLYVSGYDFGAGGNFEGTSRISWATGQLVWLEDCHGDSYGVFPAGGVVYKVSHAHYCGNLPAGGFQQTSPDWTFNFGLAYTKAPQGAIGRDLENYANFEGQPAPALLPWMPKLEQGAFTGMNQAAWTITGNSNYIVLGGEFPRAGVNANGGMASQQGLVRYARTDVAAGSRDVGPDVKTAEADPRLTSVTAGTVRVSWRANWDRDNENLRYDVYRNGVKVHEIAAASSVGHRPQLGWTDTGVTPGSTYSYYLVAIDPDNNVQRSSTVSITVPNSGRPQSAYATRVLDDGAGLFWRLSDTTAGTAVDWAGTRNGVVGSGVGRGAAGAIVGDSDTASTFNGTSAGTLVNSDGSAAQAAELTTNTFTQEAWIRTSSTRGGLIVGYGDRRTGSSSTYDRLLYMTNNGRIAFGVNPAVQRVLTSTRTYNDNLWHHVVATLGKDGMALYVDGVEVGRRADTTRGDSYYGYWRVGGDNLSGWANRPSSNYLNAVLDDVAIYPVALGSATVGAHYALGRTPGSVPNAAPTAAFTVATDGLTAVFNSSGSTDSDGTIVSRSWDFGNGATSTATNPSHAYAAAGTYTARLTVTDDDGATGTVTRSVTVSNPPPAGVLAADAFGRTIAGGLGSADTGGAWSVSAASAFSVADGVGKIAMAAPGSGPRAWLPGVSSSDVDVAVTYGLDKVADGGGMFFSLGGRVTGTNDYRAKVKIAQDGTQTLYLLRMVSNAETTLSSVVLPAALRHTVGFPMRMRLQVDGVSPTALRAKVWTVGTSEPSGWTLTSTDSTSGLQVPGGLSLATYLSGTATAAPVTVRVDDLTASSAF